jgi:hypothetical protein
MLLVRFLVAMFINKYKKVFLNQDFLNRLEIINLKNATSYDRLMGAITTSFFPINIILLPFMGPILFFKSERLNDSILKAQYLILLICYCILSITLSLVIMPILFIKSLLNAGYIMNHTKR